MRYLNFGRKYRLVSISSSRSPKSSQNRTKRSGRSYGNTTETTETIRTIGAITIAWIASSSIRTIGAIVKICKRLNGNHSRMTRTIEAIQTYPKMHRLFQDSMLFLHCVPKNAFKMAQQTRENGDEALAPVYGTVSCKISLYRVFTHVTSGHICLMKQKNVMALQKS